MTAFATARGPVFEVTPSGPAVGSTLAFPVLPSDLDAIGNYKPTTRYLFIAIYEPKLQLWVPLPTQYHAATKTLTAVPPHFSEMRKSVYNGLTNVVSTLGDASATGFDDANDAGTYAVKKLVTGVMAFEQQIVDSAKIYYAEFTASKQRNAPCEDADPTYKLTAASHRDKFPGCVHSDGGEQLLEVGNHWLLPFGLKLPAGAAPRAPFSTYDHLADMIAGVYYKALNGAYLPAHSYGTASLSSPLTTRNSWSGTLRLDTFAFAISTILAVMAIIPADREFTELNATFKEEILQVLSEKGPISVHGFFLDLEEETKTVGLNQNVDALGKLGDAVACIQSQYNAAGDLITETSSVSEALNTVTEAAIKCAAAAVDSLASAGRPSQYGQILAGAPELVGALRGIWQATFAGPSIEAISLEVTHPLATRALPATSCVVDGRPFSSETSVPSVGIPRSVSAPSEAVAYVANKDKLPPLIAPPHYHCTFSPVTAEPSDPNSDIYTDHFIYGPSGGSYGYSLSGQDTSPDSGIYGACLSPAGRNYVKTTRAKPCAVSRNTIREPVDLPTGVPGFFGAAYTDDLESGHRITAVISHIIDSTHSTEFQESCPITGKLRDYCLASMELLLQRTIPEASPEKLAAAASKLKSMN